jgi:hypothetical protein
MWLHYYYLYDFIYFKEDGNMSKSFRKGERVEHDYFGEGTVTEDAFNLDEVEVGFSEIETFTLPMNQLKNSEEAH